MDTAHLKQNLLKWTESALETMNTDQTNMVNSWKSIGSFKGVDVPDLHGVGIDMAFNSNFQFEAASAKERLFPKTKPKASEEEPGKAQNCTDDNDASDGEETVDDEVVAAIVNMVTEATRTSGRARRLPGWLAGHEVDMDEA